MKGMLLSRAARCHRCGVELSFHLDSTSGSCTSSIYDAHTSRALKLCTDVPRQRASVVLLCKPCCSIIAVATEPNLAWFLLQLQQSMVFSSMWRLHET